LCCLSFIFTRHRGIGRRHRETTGGRFDHCKSPIFFGLLAILANPCSAIARTFYVLCGGRPGIYDDTLFESSRISTAFVALRI
jgi:hypothetical protein